MRDSPPSLFFRPALLREQHYHYLKKGLRHLSDAYEVRSLKIHLKREFTLRTVPLLHHHVFLNLCDFPIG